LDRNDAEMIRHHQHRALHADPSSPSSSTPLNGTSKQMTAFISANTCIHATPFSPPFSPTIGEGAGDGGNPACHMGGYGDDEELFCETQFQSSAQARTTQEKSKALLISGPWY
jgi:hypothetical protein